MMNLRGRQTQFYIDVLYGITFAAGFGYLFFVEMNPHITAFQGGLIFGYFLRVWENMSVYERILQEEVAAEAQEAVAVEVEDQLPPATETEVAEQMDEHIGAEIDQRFDQEMDDRIAKEVKAEVDRQSREREQSEGEISDSEKSNGKQ